MHPFDVAFRDRVAASCAAFPRADDAVAPLPTPRGGAPAALKHAAVAITLVDDGDGAAAFLLTRRAARLNSHGGQWALPGGRFDDGETAPEAALRELHEELGLELGARDVLGLLDDYPTRSGYLITPVVLWAAESRALVPNPDEVASVHRIGLEVITDPDAVDFVDIPESPRRVVRVRVGEQRIHAPTAAVLYQFRELLAGRHTRVADLEQPTFAWR
ncbi:MAG: CoA pyrophosphatase [Burkholderiaceae bacterium]